MGVFGWRKGKGEMILFYYNIKNRRKNLTKRNTQTKQKLQSQFCVSSNSCVWGLPWIVIDIPSDTLLKIPVFLFFQKSIATSFLIMSGILVSKSQHQDIILFDPGCCHSLCEFLCVSILLYLKESDSLASSALSGSYSHSMPLHLDSLTQRGWIV